MTTKQVKYIQEDNSYIFNCPNCDLLIQVPENEVNCKIFRHGIMKTSGQQVNPHAPKDHCDRLVQQNLVYGCCKPFRLFRGINGIIEYADICEYI